MKIVWDTEAWEDYLNWLEQDKKTFLRINELIKECMRSPFSGLGKPEPLRGELKGWWSRRINREDRLIYRVSGTKGAQALEIIYCRGHYL